MITQNHWQKLTIQLNVKLINKGTFKHCKNCKIMFQAFADTNLQTIDLPQNMSF